MEEFICHVHRLTRNTAHFCENVFRLLFELSEIFRRIPEFDPRESKQLFHREINHLKYLIDTIDDFFRQNPAHTLPYRPSEVLNVRSWFLHVHCGHAIELLQVRTLDNNLSFRPHLHEIETVFRYIWDSSYPSPFHQARNVTCTTLTDCSETLFYSFNISPNRYRVITARQAIENPNLTTRENRNLQQSPTLSPNALTSLARARATTLVRRGRRRIITPTTTSTPTPTPT